VRFLGGDLRRLNLDGSLKLVDPVATNSELDTPRKEEEGPRIRAASALARSRVEVLHETRAVFSTNPHIVIDANGIRKSLNESKRLVACKIRNGHDGRGTMELRRRDRWIDSEISARGRARQLGSSVQRHRPFCSVVSLCQEGLLPAWTQDFGAS